MWKANNINNYPLAANPEARLTRAVLRRDREVEGRSLLSTSTFINDASIAWNRIPEKNKKTIYSAKRQIREYVLTLPL